ncbi:MAG: alpha/beta hydrolase [Pyrinomonadaceae bacterium]
MKKTYLALGAVGGAVGGVIAWKMLTRPRSIYWREVADKVHHAEHSNFAEVDGATVHYQEFGDPSRPTLILIHGYTASTHVWRTVAPMLAEMDFHVIAVDLLGFGYSDKPAWFDYTIDSQARMVMRLMNVLGIGQATLVGSSYGGAVASILTLDYPERVSKLVLVSAVCNDEAKNNPLLRLATVPGVGEVLAPFLLDSKALLKYRMNETFAPENKHLVTQERVDSVHRPLSAADAHHSVLKSARRWRAGRVQRDAHLIDQPTLLIWGEDDSVIPIHNGFKLHREILNSRFVVFRQCGHIPSEEAPDNFVEIVTAFCRDRKGKIEIGDNEQMRLEGAE